MCYCFLQPCYQAILTVLSPVYTCEVRISASVGNINNKGKDKGTLKLVPQFGIPLSFPLFFKFLMLVLVLNNTSVNQACSISPHTWYSFVAFSFVI